MNSIKPKRLTWDSIRETTNGIRQMYMSKPDQIPVPIEEIIEFKYFLNIVPIIGLKNQTDIEGLLLSDLKTIFIDNSSYNDDKFQKRMRFTLAHELGHLILHGDQIKEMKFQTVEEWISFREKMDEDDLDWFERQAKEFAGSLLVPSLKLEELIEKNNKKIKKYIDESLSEDANERAIDGISRILSDEFNVSSHVIKHRIRIEKIWDKFGF